MWSHIKLCLAIQLCLATQSLFVVGISSAQVPEPLKSTGVMVDLHNAQQWRALLPRFLFDRVASGQMPLHVLGESSVAVGEVASKTVSTVSDISMDHFASESAFTSLLAGGDPQPFAMDDTPNVLWNLYANWWQYHYLKSHSVVLDWQPDSALPSESEIKIERVLPLLQDGKRVEGQLFRERVSFSAPDAYKGYEFLTIRFWNGHVDAFWTASRALKSVFRLVAANRDDVFTGGAVALNDLLGWSTGLYSIKVQQSNRVRRLVPQLRQRDLLSSQVDDDCVVTTVKDFSRDRSLPHLNGFSGRIYSDLDFSEAELIHLDLIVLDPYSEVGREEVWLDSITGAPVYRAVYGRSGRLRKWSMLVAQGEGAGSRQQPRSPVFRPIVQFVYDANTKKSSYLLYSSVETCVFKQPKQEAPFGLSYYDPAQLGDFKHSPPAAATAVPTIVTTLPSESTFAAQAAQ